jgi:heptosyltransferase-2
VICETCPEYDRVGTRILIIKLDALGDVLRTTCVLRPLKQAFPDSHVTWITGPGAVTLLKEIPEIDVVMPADWRALAHLQTARFDRVYGFDAAQESASLAAIAQVREICV